MEVFIVEATSTFEQELGNKLGAAYSRRGVRAGGTQGGSSVGAPSGGDSRLSEDTANFGAGKDTLLNFPAACLLYTSPSPRDKTPSRMPSSA